MTSTVEVQLQMQSCICIEFDSRKKKTKFVHRIQKPIPIEITLISYQLLVYITN